MKYIISILILLTFILSTNISVSSADEKKGEPNYHHLTPYSGTPEFEMMKNLVGTWKGTTKMGDKEKELNVTYNTASAGSIIVERMFPETPEEMVSIYYDVDGKLSMTHYCALKNQPHMTLKDSKDNRIDLAFSAGSNLNNKKDPYMHSLSIDFVDNDNIIHTWTMYDEGKEKEVTTFKLTRVD